MDKFLPSLTDVKRKKDPNLIRNMTDTLKSILNLGELTKEASNQFSQGYLKKTNDILHDNFKCYLELIEDEVKGKSVLIEKLEDVEHIMKIYVMRQDLIGIAKLIDLQGVSDTQ